MDLGADFRLNDAATYERWYGHPHEAPQFLDSFVYGIPELDRDAIKSAKAVAAAGCGRWRVAGPAGRDGRRDEQRRRWLGRRAAAG